MNKKDRDKVKLREVVHRQLRFEMWPLTFFWVGETSDSLLTTILQGPGDSNHKLAQKTAPASGVIKVAFLPIERTLEE